jgi:hypothetical protein
MRLWPFPRNRQADRNDELDDAHKQVDRAIRDAKQLRCRADEVVERLSETRRRNHIAEAVARVMRGKTT